MKKEKRNALIFILLSLGAMIYIGLTINESNNVHTLRGIFKGSFIALLYSVYYYFKN